MKPKEHPKKPKLKSYRNPKQTLNDTLKKPKMKPWRNPRWTPRETLNKTLDLHETLQEPQRYRKQTPHDT